MEKFKNLHKLKNRKTESWITLEIDIAPLLSKSNAMLNIYRAGYHPKDRKDVPFKSFAIPFSVIDENNKYEAHRVSLSSNLGRTRIEIGGSEPQHLIADLNLSHWVKTAILRFRPWRTLDFTLQRASRRRFRMWKCGISEALPI